MQQKNVSSGNKKKKKKKREAGAAERRSKGKDNSRASDQRHTLADPRPLIQIHVDEANGPLGALLGPAVGVHTAELQPDGTPGIDDHAVAVAAALRVVRADLRRGDDPALRLDGARAQQRLPVRGARLEREGGRVQQDLGDAGAAVLGQEGAAGRRVGEGEGGLREAEVEADEGADAADRGGERGRQGGAGLDGGGLAEGAVVEEVELVVGRGGVDGAVCVDPEAAVEESGPAAGGGWRGRGRDVDADVDGERVLLCRFLEAEDEGGCGLGLGEGE